MGFANVATWAVVGAAVLTGCTQPTEGEQIQNATAQVKSGKELAVLALLNDRQTATFDVLDVDCAIRKDAARNIIVHRDGQDETPDTADDDLFDSVSELDSVSQVGEWTIDQLTQCADHFGFMPTADDVALLNFLNDYEGTTLERLDVDCSLYSNAAENLIAHRDGPDGVAITLDDDPFHSATEVDKVPQVGEASMSKLYACAKSFGYDGELEWSPTPVAVSVISSDPSILFSQADGVIYLDGQNAPQGAEITLGFHGHEYMIRKGPLYLGVWGIGRDVPAGYGGQDLGDLNGVSRIRITSDPLGTIDLWEALEIARADLITYLQDVRMHKQDWENSLTYIDTWEAALAAGIMEGIDGFCNPAYDSEFTISPTPAEYHFTDRGPLGLYTVIHVSKTTEKGVYFYVEID
ncbi:MAG: hypothetical protein JRI68_25215 [Deltaproteobacteria bacterium]|nr:hypothetical protein [Deltaproteobacteria bacterium]